ncbi:MAG: glycosyltransferase [Bacteroidetes bacterium]|nr:glycosyltransferase [Bacteroidota bacterium]
MSASPKISVILPVYNAEKYIAEAITSILSQTFSNFELIVVNDGSNDRSEEIILSFKDDRIVYLRQKNAGLAATLNKGISLANGEYIARQDNDDISLPERLEKQLNFLEEHKEVSLLGTWAEIIDEQGRSTGRFHRHHASDSYLKFFLLFDNPFVHSSVMFRKESVKQIGAYNVSPELFEDYNLWSRLARVSRVANLQLPLLKYREVNTGMSRTASDYKEKVKRQSSENIRYYLPEIKEEDLKAFTSVDQVLAQHKSSKAASEYFQNILIKLQSAFCQKERVSPEAKAEKENNVYHL